EDDLVFQTTVANFLQQRGYHVSTANAGEQGIEDRQNKSPDIILCDLKLPHMSGIDALEALVTQCSEVPLIVISASEDRNDIREAVRLGAWDYLVKPIADLEVIDFAIRNCLDRHQLEDAHEREALELDHHIDLLYQDSGVVQRLAEALKPQGALQVNGYQFEYSAPDSHEVPILIDYRPLTEGVVMVVSASCQSLAGQHLVALLVLKTLLNPLFRQALAKSNKTLLQPAELMAHLNYELCRSKLRTAFDVMVGIVDTSTGTLRYCQAGEHWQSSLSHKPDLSLGIWQQASFREHHQALSETGQVVWQLDDF